MATGVPTPAIVLAAGASRRMGRPKPLLQTGGQTFIRRIVATLHAGGVATVVVVVRQGDHAVAAESEAAGARVTVNPRAEDGQLSSLIAGIEAVDRPGVEHVLVTLADVPLITPETVRSLVARAAASSAPIVRAVHGGRHGHPVVFRRDVFAALRAADPAKGAKEIFGTFQVENVECGDPGVLRDVDTPEDYQNL